MATLVQSDVRRDSIRERMIGFEVENQRVIIDPLPRSDLDSVVNDWGWGAFRKTIRVVKRSKAGFSSPLTYDMRRDHWGARYPSRTPVVRA